MKIRLRTRLLVAIMGITLVATVITGSSAIKKANEEFTKVVQETLANTSAMLEYMLDTQYPGDWGVTNRTLHKGTENLTEQTFIKELNSKTGTYLMLYAGLTEAAGNLEGFTVASAISTKVLSGESIMEAASFGEKKLMLSYQPLKDGDGMVVGMFVVGVEETQKEEAVQQIKGVCIAMAAIGFVVSFFLALGLSNRITRPLYMVKRQLEKMCNHDFTMNEEISQPFPKMETGEIVEATKALCVSAAQMVNRINEESKSIAMAANGTDENLLQLSKSIEEVSGSTEEISAGMEEVSNGTTQVSVAVNAMVKQVQAISENVKTGEVRVTEIYARANGIKDEAVLAKEQANTIMETGKQRMETVIKQSEKINRIKELTDTIAGIAGQTKLLSLNASIEAARAGEAGRGFAVVASEIRGLSEASQQAVNSIREVAELVLDAVTELVKISTQTIEELGGNTNQAYERLVTTGEIYQQDAVLVSDLLEAIKKTFGEAESQMETMTDAMEQMSHVVAESTQGTTVIANHSTEMVREVSEILSLSKQTKECSTRLKDLIKKIQYE